MTARPDLITQDWEGVQRNFDALARLRVQQVTALPTRPFDTQTVDYVADAANGVVWRLRYRQASTSAYKWEFVGGPPLLAEVAAAQARANTAYGDLATVGPSITLPLAGDYIVRHGFHGNQAAASDYAKMSFAIGATAAADANQAEVSSTAASAIYDYIGTAREQRLNALAAATALVAKYRTGGGSGTFQQRWLAASPVRVG